MRQVFVTNSCVVIALVLTSFVIVLLVTFVPKGFYSSSLPYSAWSRTTSAIGFYQLNHSSPPQIPPALYNERTALYPHFNNPKMQRAVQKLIDELNAATELRRDKERDQKMEKIEAGLAKARSLIKAAMVDSATNSSLSPLPDADYIPQGEIYKNAYVFQRSYLLMEKIFKIYIYGEGEPPLFHSGPFKEMYSIEGIFNSLLETSKKFRTYDPDKASVYFLPFSVVMILDTLFDPIIRDKGVLGRVVGDYVRIISTKYGYWNRSLGADHFMLSCHDWGPRTTWYVHELYFTSIRVLCNANSSENFNPRKDVSCPEVNLPGGGITGITGGLPYKDRTILAFFAGQLHGFLRRPLFQHWKDKDEDIRVYESSASDGISYGDMMKKSKYCICPSGYEVASPRIVEAIYAECVPVLLSEHYVLPFSEILDWRAFSIQISVDDIPNLKNILMEISEERYLRMRERVKQVQRHFVVNDPPQRYDVFHMIIHSIWLRRLNVRIYG